MDFSFINLIYFSNPVRILLRETSMKKIMAIAILFALLPMTTFSASFDCTKASTYVEKMICSDETISKLDEQLAKSYKQALEKALLKDDFKMQQRVWLGDHRDTCKDAECLKMEYENRIVWLNETAAMEIPKNTVNGEYIWIKNALNSHADPLNAPVDKNVCQDFLKNLNSFRAPKPMLCETKLNLEIPGFTSISWKPIGTNGVEKLLVEMEKIDLKYDSNAAKKLSDKNYIDRVVSIYKEDPYLEYTVLKSSDGKAYSLIRFNRLIKQGCTNTTHLYQESSYFYTPVDFSKLSGLYENVPLEKLCNGLIGEIIIYNNNIYLFSSNGTSKPIDSEVKKVTDYHLSQVRMHAERDNYTGDEICRYQFIWPIK